MANVNGENDSENDDRQQKARKIQKVRKVKDGVNIAVGIAKIFKIFFGGYCFLNDDILKKDKRGGYFLVARNDKVLCIIRIIVMRE
jgi:hypothetical protein